MMNWEKGLKAQEEFLAKGYEGRYRCTAACPATVGQARRTKKCCVHCSDKGCTQRCAGSPIGCSSARKLEALFDA